jgi:hypothetical protein
MNEKPEPDLPRFVVRKGRMAGSWMVWDRKTQRPAKMQQGVAARLTKPAKPPPMAGRKQEVLQLRE